MTGGVIGVNDESARLQEEKEFIAKIALKNRKKIGKSATDFCKNFVRKA